MTAKQQICVQGQAFAIIGCTLENIEKYAEPFRQVINTNERFHRETSVRELLAITEG